MKRTGYGYYFPVRRNNENIVLDIIDMTSEEIRTALQNKDKHWITELVIGLINSERQPNPQEKTMTTTQYHTSKATATDSKGHILFQGIYDSNGEACEALAQHFNLSEEQHQILWDELSYSINDVHLSVEWQS